MWVIHITCGRYISHVGGTYHMWVVHITCGRYISHMGGTYHIWAVHITCARWNLLMLKSLATVRRFKIVFT